ncbi:MAG: TetR/AcrR family transcriptional regulator [Deltaproteobacteria bacterium]|nr:TetR/AcrR family transcriptional regulator [Deltaproteobacteria bacterium]
MPNPKLTPRKAPRQDRAKATVEAIVIAAERLTRQGGIEAWTTNHVAELAGASIGSLYQYFPSKESLVVALYLHRREGYVERLAVALAEVGKRGAPAEVAAAIAQAWFADGAPAIDWGFDLALRAYLVASGAARKLVASDEQLTRLFAQLLERRGWASAAVAPARGAAIVAMVERLLAPLAIEDARWTTPALREALVAMLAGALAGA